MMHLSPATEVAIRLLPGNDRCVDCKAICPQWAGVSFGILLCLDCAGKHRSLGVQTSFVKSLVMDAWSLSEVRALEQGGNAKWAAVCAGTGISYLTIGEKYSSGVAKAYKSRVALAAAKMPSVKCVFTAESFLSMLAEIKPSGEVNPGLFKEEDPISIKEDPISPAEMASKSVMEWRKYERKIGAPGKALGFTVAKLSSGYAEVSRVTPGGAAEQANVIVGSLLVGLNNMKNLKFDEIVGMLRTLPRPIVFHFAFHSQVVAQGLTNMISSVPEPRVVEINITLHEKEELGCSLSANDFYCVVRGIDDECIARRHGVLVGSRVIAVNGRKYLKPKDMIREICTAPRPIEVTVHRVEGLIRDWGMSST